MVGQEMSWYAWKGRVKNTAAEQAANSSTQFRATLTAQLRLETMRELRDQHGQILSFSFPCRWLLLDLLGLNETKHPAELGHILGLNSLCFSLGLSWFTDKSSKVGKDSVTCLLRFTSWTAA